MSNINSLQQKEAIEGQRTGEYKGMPFDPLGFQEQLCAKQQADITRIVPRPTRVMSSLCVIQSAR